MIRFVDDGYNIRSVDIDSKNGTLELQYYTGSHCVSSERFTLDELDSIKDDDVRLVRARDYGSIYFERVDDRRKEKPRTPVTLNEVLEAAEDITNELHATEYSFTNNEYSESELLKASLEELDAVFDYTVAIRDGLRYIIGKKEPWNSANYSPDIPF